eukprot:TRINITY_DN6140_c0_g1_i1.p2 TRINITY_DN6140_c0_g1~~TRINITY_DN6140_c0_g1_i1.p2  ORF type:complete len:116 (-),score=15.82 TRINITY_DN6140_c0_g1_i1:204-551(-)
MKCVFSCGSSTTDLSAMVHTILLVQPTRDKATRTFYDYDNVGLAMEGLKQMYEYQLKVHNPHERNIQYNVSDLYNFLDGFADISCLVFNNQAQAYTPYPREWVKTQVFQHLRRAQ